MAEQHPIILFAEDKLDKAFAEFKRTQGAPEAWATLMNSMMRYQQVAQRAKDPDFDERIDRFLCLMAVNENTWADAVEVFGRTEVK